MDQSDQESGSELFEQGDEALDEAVRIDPEFVEALEQDPSLDPALQVDERELDEAGAMLDDPESKVMLEGGIDDPDGLGEPGSPIPGDDEGWDLDAPGVADGGDDRDSIG